MLDEWKGFEAVCIASGPSFTADDAETIRQWRDAASTRVVIVCNTMFRACPWADVVFAMDYKWWNQYMHELKKDFRGRLMTQAENVTVAERLDRKFKNFQNSGAGCVSLAILKGVKRAVMVGYDCQRTNGKMHSHPDHPKGLINGLSMPTWPRQFALLADYAKQEGCVVVNASRETILKSFPRMPLEDALCMTAAVA